MVVSIASMIWFQMLWCCRQSYNNLVVLMGLALISAVAFMLAGLVVPHCRDDGDCMLFARVSCFICGFVWIYIAKCVFRFLNSGDYYKYESGLTGTQRADAQRAEQRAAAERNEFNNRRAEEIDNP